MNIKSSCQKSAAQVILIMGCGDLTVNFYNQLANLYAYRGPDFTMEPTSHQPIPIPAKPAVLLVFFPSASSPNNLTQRLSLTKLVDLLQRQFDASVRMLKIDESAHPDVVRSFDIRQFPAFVLVRQGIELWRHEGMLLTSNELIHVATRLARAEDS